MKRVRNSAKAIIIRDGYLLTVKKKHGNDIYYVLPGGGQRSGETLQHALLRECREETGVDVEADDLLFVREYIGRNHEFAALHAEKHSVEFVFRCEIREDKEPILGADPDNDQVGVDWLPIDRLEDYPLYPQKLRSLVRGIGRGALTTYLGDVN